MSGVKDWIVKCSHEESIHTSEAIAINWKGITGGFSGNRYL
jgi:GTP cyclohydrolase FolE2